MFDDKGDSEKGIGEVAMEYVASHPDIEVLGAVAVASNTANTMGIATDECITCQGGMQMFLLIKAVIKKKEKVKNLFLQGIL